MPRPFEIADVAIGSVPVVFSFRDGSSRPGPESINIGLSGRSPICVHGFRLTGRAGAPERRWLLFFTNSEEIARTADQRSAVFRVSSTRWPDFIFQNRTSERINTISDMNDHTRVTIDGNPVMSRLAWYRTYQLTTANKARITQETRLAELRL